MKCHPRLKRLYRNWSGQPPERIVPVAAHGSGRRYYRLLGAGKSAIGVFNTDRRENAAFLSFSAHFARHGLPVPEIYAADLDQGVYLEQDLGDETLFALGASLRGTAGGADRLGRMYRRVLALLPRFQIAAGRDLDYSVCYPRDRFDGQSMRWDLNYFKYYFLKLTGIPFDEQALEDDFDRLIAFLLQADRTHFLYRDFQSRNILWFRDRPWFIDYQGGRRGALQYDVASLLFDAKADLSWSLREELPDYYIEQVNGFIPMARADFLLHYYGYACMRIMQAFGAYGLRGLHEGKAHFLRSIPHALRNLEGVLERARLPVELPALTEVWERMIGSAALGRFGRDAGPGLTVHLLSFAYKGGLPKDETGHGGGFVFDCRALPNPGRIPAYAPMTGRDAEVIEYLDKDEEVRRFLGRATDLVEQAVQHHRRRGFTELSVSFGCTGGQHRSVFCADRLAERLRGREGVCVELRHRELEWDV